MFKTIKNFSGLAFQAIKLRNSDDEFLNRKTAQLIVQLLGQEKGIALKIAQMLGSSDEALDEFRRLTAGQDLQAIPLKEIGPVIQDRLNGKVDEYFERVEEAKWVASLGQVHRCLLKHHQGDFVLKVLYPGIKERLTSQLKLLGFLGKFGSETKLKKWGFDISDYLQNFETALEKETDYRHELKNLEKFDRFNVGREILYPIAIKELCTSELLVTSFMTGSPVEMFAQVADPKGKKEFSERLFLTYLRQLLLDGFIQGDTHAGNFYVHLNQPVFLDFGHFLELNEIEKLALQKMVANVVAGTSFPTIDLMGDLGFDTDKLKIIETKLPLFISAMFRPLFENQNFSLQSWQPKKDIESILGDDKWWIRSSGNARFFQIVRSFWGLFLILKQVGGTFNWHMCAREVLSQTGIDMSNTSRNIESENLPSMDSISTHLKVKVFRDGKLTVDLTFPAKAVFQLEGLIDEETQQKLRDRDIDLNLIKSKALQSNLEAQVLFELSDGPKSFKVELG